MLTYNEVKTLNKYFKKDREGSKHLQVVKDYKRIIFVTLKLI